MNIIKRIEYNCEILVVTGMHIGGNSDSYGIGGVDSPVIKNPLNNEPIIPGSSIKGKMRFLLEADNDVNDKLINDAFGAGKNSTNKDTLYFTRVLFRDLSLKEESSKLLQSKLGEGIFTEVKAENSIDKEKGTAISPRFIERVPQGTVFTGKVVLQLIDGDNEEELRALLQKGCELLNRSYLGGSGSRGYGQINIQLIEE